MPHVQTEDFVNSIGLTGTMGYHPPVSQRFILLPKPGTQIVQEQYAPDNTPNRRIGNSSNVWQVANSMYDLIMRGRSLDKYWLTKIYDHNG